jgi:lipopolysaccharide export system protein LptA
MNKNSTLSRWMVAAAALPLLWLAAQPVAHAARADRTKPLEYEAESGRADEKRGIYELRGNVVITKGSLTIRAERVELRDTAQGQTVVATGANGKPASFRQKREGLDEYVEGQAMRIEYDTRSETVRFTQQAVMRRVRSGAVADEVSGQSIRYDNVAEVFEVLGTPGAAASASQPGTGGRVKGVLAPRESATPEPKTDAKTEGSK